MDGRRKIIFRIPEEGTYACRRNYAVFTDQWAELSKGVTFLKGIKESAVVSLPREQSVAFSGLAARAGLNWYFLLHEDGKDMVFIYRRKELERFLQKEDVSAFLKKRGYLQSGKTHPFPICQILSELSERVESYYRTKENFPHEIGVLLGYPTEDVEGFIANEGRNCLLTGYWKVYKNERRAKQIFAAFDEAREVTVREVLEGKELLQLCTSI